MTTSVVPYERILSVLTGSLTAEMHDRQAAAVQMIMRAHPKQLVRVLSVFSLDVRESLSPNYRRLRPS